MSTRKLTLDFEYEQYEHEGNPGIRVTHPSYPNLSAQSTHYKNKSRNQDLATIRLLSAIALYERNRATQLEQQLRNLQTKASQPPQAQQP